MYQYSKLIKINLCCVRGHAVAEGRGFDSQCCHWNFSLT